MKNIKYDKIFIGAGVINIIEAIYQKKIGNNVLVIEKTEKYGGAWRPIKIFGFNNVENAVHYFLPDKKAPLFMKKKLKWPIIHSNQKFRYIKLPFLGYFHLKYDGFLSTLVSNLDFNKRNLSFLNNFIQVLVRLIFSKKNSKSYYISGGAPVIYKYLKKMISYHNIEIIFNTEIDKIYFDRKNKHVQVISGKNFFISRQVIISHGSRLKEIEFDGGSFDIDEKNYPRPALHILIEGSHPSKPKECIFFQNSTVKYVHDITNMTSGSNNIDEKKIFVFALHPNIKKNQESINYSFQLLKDIKLISKSAIMVDFYWTDVILPTLHDKDLERLKSKFGSLVDFLKTEDFAAGIGYNCDRWSKEDIFI
jgi:hypothetical protein